jgi:hypothetical protein
MLKHRAPAFAAKRRLLAALGIAPLAARRFAIAFTPSTLSLAAPIDRTGCMNVTPTAIRFFDAHGSLRVVAGCFDPSP